MKTLSQKYSNKDTRDGIAVNKTYLVPIEQLYLEPGYNIREADDAHVEYFAQCWAEGQPLPAIVVSVTDKGQKIEDGQHRYLGALRAIERGVEIVRIECKDFNGSEADKIAFMVSSSQGKALDCFERAKAYVRLKGFGWTNEEIAKKVGRSVSDVQMHLSLGDVPDEVKKRVNAGQISYANAVAVTREHGDDAAKVVDEALQEAEVKGKKKVTSKALKVTKPKPHDRLIELLKKAEHVVVNQKDYIELSGPEIEELMDLVDNIK